MPTPLDRLKKLVPRGHACTPPPVPSGLVAAPGGGSQCVEAFGGRMPPFDDRGFRGGAAEIEFVGDPAHRVER